MSTTQLFFSMTGVFITVIIAQTGFIFAAFHRLSDRVDRHYENFNNQVTTLLTTIHGVDVRVVKLEEKKN